MKPFPRSRRRSKVLERRLRHRPYLETLEDRLPPGELSFGAALGLPLGGQNLWPETIETLTSQGNSGANLVSATPIVPAASFQPARAEFQDATPQSTTRVAFADQGVHDSLRDVAAPLAGMSDPLDAASLTSQARSVDASRSALTLHSADPSARAAEGLFANDAALHAPFLGDLGPALVNGFGIAQPTASFNAALNQANFTAFTSKGRTLARPGPAGGAPAFTFVDRPDARDDENYGLVPDAYGYASGLLVTFDVSQGQLDSPQVIAAPPGCGDASATVVDDNSVLVDFGQPCVLPVAPGTPSDVDNQVALQVNADPSADVTPTGIVWMASINNVVPRRLSSETNFDGEPSVAVNPSGDFLHATVALTTFSGNWTDTQNAPIWVSGNSGLTWDQRLGVPAPERGSFGPADQNVAYNSDGSQLYGTFLGFSRSVSSYVLTTPDPLTTDFGNPYAYSPAAGTDQPWLQVGPVDADTGLDRVYLSINDSSTRATPTVIVSNDGGATFQAPIRVERGTNVNSDHPPRVAVSGDRVYSTFLRRTAPPSGNVGPGELVVVRDDQGALRTPDNPNPFSDLGPNGAGVVVQSGSYPTGGFLLGQQRIGGDISLAIDPQNPDTVYLSFSRIESGQPVLHVHRSLDGGNTWDDILSVNNAAIGNLAVASNGVWGLMNIRLDNGRMIQEFRQNGGDPTILTSWPANDPRGGVVYVGDYQYLIAVGSTFYGSFCASNAPDVADFPSGVVFQRNANFSAHQLLSVSGANVPRSIDPYFFRQEAVSGLGAYHNRR